MPEAVSSSRSASVAGCWGRVANLPMCEESASTGRGGWRHSLGGTGPVTSRQRCPARCEGSTHIGCSLGYGFGLLLESLTDRIAAGVLVAGLDEGPAIGWPFPGFSKPSAGTARACLIMDALRHPDRGRPGARAEAAPRTAGRRGRCRAADRPTVMHAGEVPSIAPALGNAS